MADLPTKNHRDGRLGQRQVGSGRRERLATCRQDQNCEGPNPMSVVGVEPPRPGCAGSSAGSGTSLWSRKMAMHAPRWAPARFGARDRCWPHRDGWRKTARTSDRLLLRQVPREQFDMDAEAAVPAAGDHRIARRSRRTLKGPEPHERRLGRLSPEPDLRRRATGQAGDGGRISGSHAEAPRQAVAKAAPCRPDQRDQAAPHSTGRQREEAAAVKPIGPPRGEESGTIFATTANRRSVLQALDQ